MYPALLPLMCTPWLPVVDWTDAPADLNGLVRFAERRNLFSARVPSHFKRSLPALRNYLSFHWKGKILRQHVPPNVRTYQLITWRHIPEDRNLKMYYTDP